MNPLRTVAALGAMMMGGALSSPAMDSPIVLTGRAPSERNSGRAKRKNKACRKRQHPAIKNINLFEYFPGCNLPVRRQKPTGKLRCSSDAGEHEYSLKQDGAGNFYHRCTSCNVSTYQKPVVFG